MSGFTFPSGTSTSLAPATTASTATFGGGTGTSTFSSLFGNTASQSPAASSPFGASFMKTPLASPISASTAASTISSSAPTSATAGTSFFQQSSLGSSPGFSSFPSGTTTSTPTFSVAATAQNTFGFGSTVQQGVAASTSTTLGFGSTVQQGAAVSPLATSNPLFTPLVTKTSTSSIFSQSTTPSSSSLFSTSLAGQQQPTSTLTLGTSTTATVSPFSAPTSVVSSSLASSAPPSKGLGGLSVSTAITSTATSASTANTQTVKDTALPNELQQSVRTFLEYVNAQKSLSSEISRMPPPRLQAVTDQTESLQNTLLSLNISTSRQKQAINCIRDATANALKYLELAQKMYEFPPSVERRNDVIQRYFIEKVCTYEKMAEDLNREIEDTYQHILSLSQASSKSEVHNIGDVKEALQTLHNIFVAISGSHHKLHNDIQLLKAQHSTLLNDFGIRGSDSVSQVPSHRSFQSGKRAETSRPASLRLNEDDEYDALGGATSAVGANNSVVLSDSALNMLLMMSPQQQPATTTTPNISFSPSLLSSTSHLQLQKPPVGGGYKRGKR